MVRERGAGGEERFFFLLVFPSRCAILNIIPSDVILPPFVINVQVHGI